MWDLDDEGTDVAAVRNTWRIFFDLCVFELGWKSRTRGRAARDDLYIQFKYNIPGKRQ